MNDEMKETMRRLMGRFPVKSSALLPVLSFIQKEKGHISEEDMKYVSEAFNMPMARVFSTASYYSLLNIRPAGKYNIRVCANIVCSLLGSDPLIDHISGSLNIREGETTPDGLFTLTPVECIASCAGAPAILINLERYEDMTPGKFDQMIDSIKKREISSPPLEKGDEGGFSE